VVEVADIVRSAGASYRKAHGRALSRAQGRALRDIAECRTPALGGQLRVCDRCSECLYSYHSCRNRHCPKCQGERTRRWLESQRSRLPSVPYYLLTFTLPAELRPLAYAQPARVYSILFRAAASALLKLTADPKYLGATPGLTGVLHTWTRAMLYHPHVHFLVTAGGISPDGANWVKPRNARFLVPGYALSTIFRAKVRDAFEKEGLSGTVPKQVFAPSKKWVVHLRHAGSGQKVLEYLARYVFRIAIANSRIESFDGQSVRFRYRDNRTSEIRRCTLTADSFLDRFLLHVLPPHFTKVRHYGLFSPSRSAQLGRLSRSLGPPQTQPAAAEALAEQPAVPPKPAEQCPACRLGRLRLLGALPPLRSRAPP
jgi:putative transposase/transposase-like zinc-binding protein